MREAQHENHKSAPLLESALVHCLMDSDAESLRLARRTRRCSMLLSTGIQAALLAAAVALPLFATQALPLIINDPPIPLPQDIRLVPVPQAAGTPSPATGPRKRPPGIYEPIAIPKDISPADAAGGQPAPDAELIGSGPIGVPDGIPGLNLPILTPERRTPPALLAPRDEPKPRVPISVSKGAQAAKLIYKVEPQYPALARQIRLEGKVELRAIIATDGTVQNLEVVSGHPLFIEATLQAVRQWRYQPTLLSGQPVDVQTYITVIFRMNRN